ncbi:tryptophan-rich sensory protein [Spiractinospora alimapuensis]|uniref:TspO/MBR family protein n=1 Tax=Spiractinospora alimapuensis TaxID=2820884 RepID=UPI001F254374|nr:TspO/MBR family protein [Spiractinospora alimapuensis]QVQ53963.1 tryptophan-rich sensory protein [Spiractinospora alimapuensis]
MDENPGRDGRRSFVGLAVFAVLVACAAVVGGSASQRAGEVYAGLEQPVWAPPAWVFGPVWLCLYVLIAVAGWLVWRAAGWRGATTALSLFLVQLILNAGWTPLFFAAEWRGVALVDIVLLLAAITVLVPLFARHSRLAASLLLPYWVWVAFATALNLSIWRLNM